MKRKEKFKNNKTPLCLSAQKREREFSSVLGAQIFFCFFLFVFFSLSFSLSHLHLHSEHVNTLLVTLSFIKSSFSIALTMMMEKTKEVSKEEKKKKSDDDDAHHHHHHRERIESWRRNLVFESFDDDDDFDVDDGDLKGEGEITKMITQRKRRAYAKLRGEFFSSSFKLLRGDVVVYSVTLL